MLMYLGISRQVERWYSSYKYTSATSSEFQKAYWRVIDRNRNLIKRAQNWLRNHEGQYELIVHSPNPYQEPKHKDIYEFVENLYDIAFDDKDKEEPKNIKKSCIPDEANPRLKCPPEDFADYRVVFAAISKQGEVILVRDLIIEDVNTGRQYKLAPAFIGKEAF
jgi:hypothetical protein